MMRFTSVKQIEIIGEATNYITDETKSKFTDIQWRQIVGLRHILVHEYFGIDNNLIWQIIAEDIPKLRKGVQSVLSFIEKE
ncbi:MAG: HepT-like ribonuclease domain-containing protein [Ferruginibacter sp.]